MRVFKTDYRQLMREYEIINSLRKISFDLSKMGKLLLFVEHKGKDGQLFKEMFDLLHKKYRTVITLPKNPLSREMLEILNESKEHVSRWETSMKKSKTQPLVELFFWGLSINSVLDQLGIKVMD